MLSVPDALPLTNAIELCTTTTHVAETEGVYVVLAFDGGARVYQHRSAHASCVWSKSGELLWWMASTVHPSGTNNEMEALELLTGLRWLHQHHRNIPIPIFGDSAVVANMALATYHVCVSNLQPIIRDIRELLSLLRYVTLQAVPRAYNTAADGGSWISYHHLLPQFGNQRITRCNHYY